MGRKQWRRLGVALAVVGAVLAVQGCGSQGTRVSTTAPAAALPAAAVEPGAAPAETDPKAVASAKPAAPKVDPAKVAASQPLAAGTPCTITVKSCVDLDSQRAWLLDGKGKIVRGPVDVATGSKTEPTPPGWNMPVYLKDKDHASNESFTNGVPDPMPYSVFFEAGGIAFHEGDPENPSGGCVHLSHEDAVAWFTALKNGDQVQVVNASKVLPARGMKYDGPIYGAGGVREWMKKHGGDDSSATDTSNTDTSTADASANGGGDDSSSN
ncbi:L,D-transpeptidase [Pseudonocardia sp. CA-107938]|uniref:L,D-transpeptidase n=1 Tax=Pseudonocardia sp. CA-107938 TaxID=3240021 RepID=UPI003D8D6132